ncbi:hypothetical protein LAG90_18580 [Marinilongibacter aquaticus]|uniref:hypothetical protein n=1 Tax=Marinilongibacter aquaticus TaxID=2975157 RepID=UPI0021BDC265|nr:hypothetical protein [Marinilongibacter aquaticus]UBM58807.1 hypothetical protein LAG90_18580 [Marinilongibacter aquaticus]
MSFQLLEGRGENAAPQWHFKPSTTGGESNPANYEPASGAESCPGGSPVRCIIEAPDAGGVPALGSETVLSYKM